MSKTCGGCTLCCFTMEVQNVPGVGTKPEFVECPHATRNGCRIYEGRPEGCRVFKCQWLADEDIPKRFRPDRIDAVFLSTKLKATGQPAMYFNEKYDRATVLNKTAAKLVARTARALPVLIRSPSGARRKL